MNNIPLAYIEAQRCLFTESLTNSFYEEMNKTFSEENINFV